VNKVKVGFFSWTEITDPAAHRSYNEWHQLDHLPEQHPIPGIAHGERWVSTPACRAARAVDEAPLAAAHYLTLYLMTEPVGPTLHEFAELGRRLAELGRFHHHRRAAVFGAWHLLEAHVAPRVLISADAVPYRPARGVYVIVEEPTDETALDAHLQWLHREHHPALVRVAGVVGLWTFAPSPLYRDPAWSMGSQRVTVCWLDDDPLEVAEAVRPLLRERWRDAPVRPVYAGPFETILPWGWDWFDG